MLLEHTIRGLLLVAQEWAAEPVPQEDRSDKLELALRRAIGAYAWGVDYLSARAGRELAEAARLGVERKLRGDL